MELYCEISGLVPNFEVLKTPMRTARSHPAVFLPIDSFVWYLIFRIISHNFLLMLFRLCEVQSSVLASTLAAYLFAFCCLRLRTIALASMVCTTSPRWFVVTLRRRMIP
jgi:hypothetical protein